MIFKQRSKIIIDGDVVYVKNDSLLDTIYYDGKFIGTAIAKVLDFTALNDLRYAGKEVVYIREIYDESTDLWSEDRIGTFIVTDIEPNDNEGLVKVTAYDYMLKTARLYTPNIPFPATLQAIYTDLLSQCGLSAKTVNLDINGDFIVEDNQFDGESCQTVLGKIAEITANYANITADDKVELKFHSSEVKNITPSDYSKFTNKKDTSPFTVLIMDESYSEGEELIFRWDEGVNQYGENSYKISDNGFCNTDDKKNALAPAILEKIKGFGYAGFELRDAFPVQNIKCGDIVDIADNEGVTTRTIVLHRELGENKSIYKASSYVKASISYNVEKPNPLRKAFIEVDKANAEIQMVASQSNTDIEVLRGLLDEAKTNSDNLKNNLEEQLSGIRGQFTEFTQDVDGLHASITSITESIEDGLPVLSNTTVDIDREGITVGQYNEDVVTNINASGLYINNVAGGQVAEFNKEGAKIKNVTTKNLNAAGTLFQRFQQNGEWWVGAFWIGEDELWD